MHYLFGILNLSLAGYIIATLAMTHITIVCVTVFLHRAQAHRALEIHPLLAHFFRLWLWLTTGMVTKAWAAIHRKHHAKCEQKEDPHSPQILGLKKVLGEGAELYRKEAKNQETLERYGHGTPDDWIERHVYTPHSALGIKLMMLINIILFGIPGITIWAIQMMWIPIFAAGIVNGVGHFWGYRNFECNDASTNISPWGIIIGGEELHNNHHTYPTSAKLSVKWWEFDIGWLYIQIFKTLGLAKVKKIPPKLVASSGKFNLDMDTVKTVISNRFQIMANYSKKVILPVLKEEKLPKLKNLLIREENLVDQKGKEKLNQILAERKNLEMVYQFRLKLQEIWNKTTATQKELLEALQEWCNQAEASGLEALRNFSMYLKTV